MAAATMERSESIREDLRRFLSGATRAESRPNRAELTQTALRLLRSLPAARDAGLEYLCAVFDTCTAQFVNKLGEGETVEAAAASAGDDELVEEIGAVLTSLLQTDAQTWAPVIAAWSLDLLGKLSSRYSARAHALRTSGLNDSVQLWMSCLATRVLTQTAIQCIERGNDDCVQPLLDTSATYAPHFDWVVAHVGSCFPQTIINRVLSVGLKEFCNQQSVTPANEPPGKLNSVVQILGHLAARNGTEICQALKTLFQASVGGTGEEGARAGPSDSPSSVEQHRLATVPFLLQLATLSPLLLTTISTDILKTVSQQDLASVASQVPSWIPRYFPSAEAVLSLVVHLVLRCDRGGLTTLQLLLRVADPTSGHQPTVQHTAVHILERVLCELQRLVHGCRAGAVPDVPLLAPLQDALPQLACHLSASGPAGQADRVVRLLSLAAACRGPSAAAHTLGRLLELPGVRLSTALHMLRALETSFPAVFVEAVQHAVTESSQPAAVLACVVRLLRWERRGRPDWSARLPQTRLSAALSGSVALLAERLGQLQTADLALEALALLQLPEALAGSAQISLAESVAGYLFYCVRRRQRRPQKLRRARLAQQLLSRLCERPVCLPAGLRALLHGAFQPHQATYLGASAPPPAPTGSGETGLLEENRQLSRSVTVPLAHTTVFHAGVIGAGRRPEPAPSPLPVDEARLNCELLVETVARCVAAARSPEEGGRTLALLLVEFISPDVMFNGLPWPDEEFTKVTMERDLQIRRFFDTHPLAWCLLDLVARLPPALCYCSVLLRAVAATLLQYWSTTQEVQARDSPLALSVTEKLLHLMSLGRLLPTPLTLITEMLASLTAYEVSLLVSDVWSYMRETVPTPAAFTLSAAGTVSRSFPPLDPRFTRNLLLVLQNNITTLGHLFPQVRQHVLQQQNGAAGATVNSNHHSGDRTDSTA